MKFTSAGRSGRRVVAGWALVVGVSVALAAAAADMPLPKVMSGIPNAQGKWRMEPLEVPGASKEDLARAQGGMMICQTAAKALAGEDRPGRGPSDESCPVKMIEDTAQRAVMESTCGNSGRASRTTITRVGPQAYEMAVQDLKAPNERPMRMRMSYVGACAASDSVISLDKESPACKAMRGQLAEMEQARASCASGGAAQRAQCEQMVDASLARIKSMCGG
jgi:hypothetical protein